MKIHLQASRLGEQIDPTLLFPLREIPSQILGNRLFSRSPSECRSLSSMSESLTQKWLRQNVHPYLDRDRVYADVDSLLARFPTLRPKSDVYSSVIPSPVPFSRLPVPQPMTTDGPSSCFASMVYFLSSFIARPTTSLYQSG
jgi:hypothetical protein